MLLFCRDRKCKGVDEVKPGMRIPVTESLSLTPYLQDIRERCNECGICMQSCAFLSQYGTPKAIVATYDFTSSQHQAIAYECSLCGLCTAVCPEKLDPARLFLEVRRHSFEDGNLDKAAYRTMLGYEQIGSSPLISWYGIPDGCDTIFFPGCTLPGTRPVVTTELYRRIQEIIPTVGLVFDCCAKPSHDLGRTEYFQSHFKKLYEYLKCRGIRTVLTACPSCTKIFRQYGHELTIRTVYEVIQDRANGNAPIMDTVVTVHDPCMLRDDPATQQAIRNMLADMGFTLVEMEHCGIRTLCCGEGGMVGAVNQERAREWADIRGREAGGRQVVTYCAGCAGYLNRVVPTVHIADLLRRPEAVVGGNLKIARAPFTYWNRFMLKRRMTKEQDVSP